MPHEIKAANTLICSKQTQIDQLQSWLDELEGDIDSVTSKTTTLDDTINETSDRVNEYKEKVLKLRDELAKLDVIKYIVSEEGVKSYIVSKLLNILNGRMAHYLKLLDANSVCIFNEYFEEEILNEKNKTCSYFNFSGAERKAIDLACLFTFSDLRRMQGEVQYNISIYDELFDSSFDDKGIELVADIIQQRVDELDECVLLISHRKETIKNISGDVIYLEKQDGITRRKEYLEIS